MPRASKGVEICAAGVVLLIINLISRHAPPLIHNDLLIFLTGWAGSILVIVGVGAIAFLEQH